MSCLLSAGSVEVLRAIGNALRGRTLPGLATTLVRRASASRCPPGRRRPGRPRTGERGRRPPRRAWQSPAGDL